MAFQGWEEAGLRIILTSFVAAGYETEAQCTAMLSRLKLEQELRVLQSQATNVRAAEDTQNQQFFETWAALQARIAAKQAEIDALAG